MANFQLPNVLMANRSPVSIALALCGASICAFGVVEGCRLAREMNHLPTHAPASVSLPAPAQGGQAEPP
jgi:hypothetical protein